MRIYVAIVFGVLPTVMGCSSYESTYFTVDDEGHHTITTVAGVPIVVTVPQKIGFLATESTYRIETFITSADGTTGAKGPPQLVTETTIDRTPIPLGSSQLVNLDIKRPVYGTAKTDMELANQYPTKLTSDVNDLTLGRILDTADKILDKIVTKQGVTADGNKTLISQKSFMIVYDPNTQAISRVRL